MLGRIITQSSPTTTPGWVLHATLRATEIVNQALSNPASANDIIYAVPAAQSAYIPVSKRLRRRRTLSRLRRSIGCPATISHRPCPHQDTSCSGRMSGAEHHAPDRSADAPVSIHPCSESLVSAFRNGLTVSDILTAQGRTIAEPHPAGERLQ